MIHRIIVLDTYADRADARLMENIKSENRLGVDFGRVIMGAARPDGSADTSFLSGSEARAMETQGEAGAFETIRDLCAAVEGDLWIVSKCGPRIERRTRRWLDHQRFFEATGVPRNQLRFCRERREKKRHCRELALSHFIDDRMDVLTHLRGLVPHLLWFGAETRARPGPPWVHPVADWQAVRASLLGEDDVGGVDPVREPHAVGREEEAGAGRGHLA